VWVFKGVQGLGDCWCHLQWTWTFHSFVRKHRRSFCHRAIPRQALASRLAIQKSQPMAVRCRSANVCVNVCSLCSLCSLCTRQSLLSHPGMSPRSPPLHSQPDILRFSTSFSNLSPSVTSPSTSRLSAHPPLTLSPSVKLHTICFVFSFGTAFDGVWERWAQTAHTLILKPLSACQGLSGPLDDIPGQCANRT